MQNPSRQAIARPATAVLVLYVLTAIAAGAQASIWDGIYTEEQARRGRRAYLRDCKECHGEDLRGGETAAGLVGKELIEFWSEVSVGDVLADIRDTMPEERPGELGDRVYADILAYLFQANKFPSGEEELDSDVDALLDIDITPTPPGE